MVIDNNGNVGIGTTSPNSKLDVNGTVRAPEICDETGANCKDISTGWSAVDATKLPLAGGSFTGVLAMGTNKITGLAAGTAATDAATKGQMETYVDASTADMKTVTAGTYDRDTMSLEALAAEIAAIKAQNVALAAQNTALATALATAQTDITTLKADTTILKADATTLKADTAQIITDVGNIPGAGGSKSYISSNTDLVVGNSYFFSESEPLFHTLPATCNAGDEIKVSNASGTWTYALC